MINVITVLDGKSCHCEQKDQATPPSPKQLSAWLLMPIEIVSLIYLECGEQHEPAQLWLGPQREGAVANPVATALLAGYLARFKTAPGRPLVGSAVLLTGEHRITAR